MSEQAICPWRGLDEMQSSVRAYLRVRLRDENDVEDVAQEVFLRAARSREPGREPQSIRAWVLRIAENTLTDHRRRRRRRQAREVGEDGLAEIAAHVPARHEEREEPAVRVDERLVERRRVLEWMAEALAELDREDQFVLDSYYAASERCPAIARSLQVESRLVKTRLLRARHRVRDHVRRRVEDVIATGKPSKARARSGERVEVLAPTAADGARGRSTDAEQPRRREAATGEPDRRTAAATGPQRRVVAAERDVRWIR